MSIRLTSAVPGVEHWDAFWRARDKAIREEDAGTRDPAPARFWEALFRREFGRNREPRLIDIACGNGAVIAIAMQAAAETGARPGAHCVDYSLAAVAELCKHLPEVRGVTCDARAIPFADQDFDIVVSQFGVEYAGDAAFLEAARLVAPDGNLAAIVHLADGAIYRECADNLAVAEALRESELMARARAAFAAGFDLIAGRIDDAEFQEADKRLAPAVEVAKNILREKGPRAAGGLLAKLYRDIGHMYTRMQNYVPDEVFAWIDGMSAELVSYEGRMASMMQSALDERAMDTIVGRISAMDLDVRQPEILSLEESGKPAAWILTARRRG